MGYFIANVKSKIKLYKIILKLIQKYSMNDKKT